MKRVIGCTALVCLLALTVGCGGASSTGTLAYISNSTGTGFTVFTVNTNGTLTPSSISPLNTPAAPKVIQFTPNGKWAYFLDDAGANIFAYLRVGNGSLGFIDSYPVTGAAASSLVIAPNSQFLYVALPGPPPLPGVPATCLTFCELAVYSIDQGTGILSQVGSNVPVGYAITQLIMGPSGSVLYALSPSQQQVVSFPISPSGGNITGPSVKFSVGNDPPDDGMILSPNGLFLYVLDKTATGSFTNVATGAIGQSPTIYGISTSSAGTLQVMSGSPFHENADLIHLQSFPLEPVAGVVSNDNRYLYIANQGSHNISVFRILTTGNPGELSEVLGSVTSVNGISASTQSPFDCGSGCSTPAFVAVAHSNNALYVLDTAADRIFQFAIDQNTGRLRALSPASVAAESGPTWITIR